MERHFSDRLPSSPIRAENAENQTEKVKMTLSEIIEKYERRAEESQMKKVVVKKSSNYVTAKVTSQNTLSRPGSTPADQELSSRKKCKACEAKRLEKEAFAAKCSQKSGCSKPSTPTAGSRKSDAGMRSTSVTENAWNDYRKEFEKKAKKWRLDSLPKPVNFYGILFKKVPSVTQPLKTAVSNKK